MLPRAVGPVAGKMVRIRHAGNHVNNIADRGPILAVGRDIVAARLTKDIRADVDTVFVQNIRGIHQKALDGLRLRLVIFVAVVDVAVFLIIIRAVREADIVELDLVKAHGLHCVDSQRDLILPDIAAEGTRPVAGCDIQRLAGAVGNGVLGMILAEEGVVEGCQTADHIESCVLDFLNDCLIICDGVLGVLIRRGGIFLVHRRIVADGRAIHDVDDEGVDLRRFCVFDVLVDIF